MGTKCEETRDGMIPTILTRGSFHLKTIVPPGETDPGKLNIIPDTALGMVYDAPKDKFYITLKILDNQ